MIKNELMDKCVRLEKENKLLKDKIRKLEHLAYFDSLTKLIFTQEGFEHELGKQIRDFERWSYLFVDVDDFGKVNKAFGHLFADKLLKKVIVLILRQLQKNQPTPFIMYRPYGGDEIGVILLGSSEREAVEVAENIRKTISSDRTLGRYGVTVSIGVSEIEFGGITTGVKHERRASKREFTVLRRHADIALSESKNKGKNKVCRWSEVEPVLLNISR